MELKSQLVATTRSNTVQLTFNQPLRIPNKIALKSLYYPKVSVIKWYNLYLREENDEIISIPIRTGGAIKNSNNISWLIYEAIWDHCELTGRRKPQLIEWDKPHLHPNYSNLKELEIPARDYIFLPDTEFKILFDKDFHFFNNSNNIFDFYDKGEVNINNAELGFSVNYHEIVHKDRADILTIIYCNIVAGSYFNNKIEQILELVNLNGEKDVNEIIIDQPMFKDTIYDEVLTLVLEIKTLNDESIEFIFSDDRPVVYTLLFK